MEGSNLFDIQKKISLFFGDTDYEIEVFVKKIVKENKNV